MQPIFKDGVRNSLASYRSISLTSVCGKLPEHFKNSAVTAYRNQNTGWLLGDRELSILACEGLLR